ncbi:MAG: DUF3301 domain-containing protein [Gammaproteobacteria bacterium]|nr:DUF3301 domain-containing protein [Gammaproteobacteria bacterium]NIR82278.1 DUF3301 domain-containing protein [Gammaproteobacteria bacterium]NIR91209.1 DUF3301 domain-containing protein [Gammaproteobacteria bacterium]NIU03427.1 DUF3301 domain-containing protein [Gammaproteobacteria bacterium]NIX84702.1 DUF3301 domain-containing protein [Gammaproteobacteria bacterium]
MTNALVILLLLGLVAWLWLDTMRGRELAVRVSRQACRSGGVQLLDETVALRRLDIRRCEGRGLCLRRVYEFEYSTDGRDRLSGSVTLLGRHVQAVYLPGVTEVT